MNRWKPALNAFAITFEAASSSSSRPELGKKGGNISAKNSSWTESLLPTRRGEPADTIL